MRICGLLTASVTLVTGLVHISSPWTGRRRAAAVAEVERTLEGVQSDFCRVVNGALKTTATTRDEEVADDAPYTPNELAAKDYPEMPSSRSDTTSRRKMYQLRVPARTSFQPTATETVGARFAICVGKESPVITAPMSVGVVQSSRTGGSRRGGQRPSGGLHSRLVGVSQPSGENSTTMLRPQPKQDVHLLQSFVMLSFDLGAHFQHKI